MTSSGNARRSLLDLPDLTVATLSLATDDAGESVAAATNAESASLGAQNDAASEAVEAVEGR